MRISEIYDLKRNGGECRGCFFFKLNSGFLYFFIIYYFILCHRHTLRFFSGGTEINQWGSCGWVDGKGLVLGA